MIEIGSKWRESSTGMREERARVRTGKAMENRQTECKQKPEATSYSYIIFITFWDTLH